jgi:hypothetical protein
MFENLARINEEKASAQAEANKATEAQIAHIELQQTVVKSFKALVDFLDNRTSKTLVVNQLREIGTPDALKVVSAVESLHDTLKTHENTDLTELTGVMRDALDELKSIPKELPVIPEQEQIDYSDMFKSMTDAVKGVEQAVKSQETTVEAPVVNVDAPIVNVDAPDLKPLTKELSAQFKKAIDGIKYPEVKPTDIQPLVKEQKETNKTLKKILDKPVGGGGGGGGSSWVAVDTNDIPIPIQLDGSGAVSTTSPALRTELDDSNDPILYIGKAPIGSNISNPVWQIAKLDTSSGLSKTWADNAGFTQVWSDRSSLTYN